MDRRPVFSIVTICFRRLAYLQESLGAMLRQTYPHVEIAIVNNGAIPEVYDYIMAMAQKDKRIKIVHFKENQWRDDDPGHMNRVCLNAGLQAATGDFVFYQSDDDAMADDYVEKMVALFENNPDCTSAAGFIKDMDESGKLLPEGPRVSNFRPKYMPGHLLALSTLDPVAPRTMFSAPGCIFAFRRQDLIKAGGFHTAVEDSHMFGIVPFGATGFNESAVFYWRRHDGQLNRYLNVTGYTGFDITMDLFREWDIHRRWQEAFGKDLADYVMGRLMDNNCHAAANWFVVNLYNGRLKAAFRLFGHLWNKKYFWLNLPRVMWQEKKVIYYNLKPRLKRLLGAHGWLKSIPGMGVVARKVNQ